MARGGEEGSMRLDLLTKLADALEARVPKDRFDLRSWYSDRGGCDFIGCAVGWGVYLGILDGLEFLPGSMRIVLRGSATRLRCGTP